MKSYKAKLEHQKLNTLDFIQKKNISEQTFCRFF